MAKALTEKAIRDLRMEAEMEIRGAEHTIVQWRAILSDLEAAERVLESFVADTPERPPTVISSGAMSATVSTRPAMAGGGVGFSVRNPFRHNTNKAFVWEVLDTSTNPWLNANQIQERVSTMKRDLVPMSSISPTLSEMKAEFLERKGMLVALKSRLTDSGAAKTSEFDALLTLQDHKEEEFEE